MQQFACALLFGLAIRGGDVRVAHSFSPASSPRRTVSTRQTQQQTSRLLSMPDDDYPSDYDADDLESTEKTVSVDTDEDDAAIRDELKRELILLASVTNRGMCASTEEENLVVDLVTQLEALNPTADPALNSQGDWELCYSSTESFRSSPFFLAVRAFLGDENQAAAENLFTIHDRATTASRVGKVRQIVDQDNRELVSEYDLSVGLLPGLPVRVKGCVVTSADLTAIAPETWEMTVRGTKVNGSNVPFLDQYLDDNAVEIPVGEAYKAISGSVPTAILKTYYVDQGMRITRDVDDNFFVFTRA
eukprot:CAMPEP_0172534474 /NCGR_PEP_ID=MMETSP1067-20121228/6827_1 /TAXON_ID=265564 ORGANISM="Thalassiosira punctigera, Strain Tpunct2005C2" /NCGR_SAMPLE_ID=MMETSP1067 /ASSEMBLY_ACC=CAM_ASM_000444 /LENGTH=303 /DNA_ID=CAMNT_0013319273 /DNA_START=72 /DNA_END=983 /DNA_ORIENTATION=-